MQGDDAVIKWLAHLLFLLAMSGETGYRIVRWLVEAQKWIEMNIFGLEYQPFWLGFIIPVVLLGVAVVVCLWRIGSWLKEMFIELAEANAAQKAVRDYLDEDYDEDVYDERVR